MEIRNYRNIKITKTLKYESSGFTLIEILVVMGIIVFFTGLVLVNYKTGGDQFALQRSANKLAQDIRRAEQMAMSAKEFHGVVPEGGYGIRVTSSSSPKSRDYYVYTFFADCDNDKWYDGEIVVPGVDFDPSNPDRVCTVGSDCPCNGYSEKVEEFRVEKGVKTELEFYGKPTWLTQGRVIFRAPDPVVSIRYGACFWIDASPIEASNDTFDVLTAKVILETDPASIKTITVNKAGLVEVE